MELPVVMLYKKCQSFPPLDKIVVTRDYIIDSVISIVSASCPVVFIEGEGKTTFLAQFAMHECGNTICTFINSSTKWAYNPNFIRNDLYDQIAHALGRDTETLDVDSTIFSSAIYELHKKAQRSGIIYYFVIDGLDEIPVEEAQIKLNILSMLPIGLNNFRFLISMSSEEIMEDIAIRKVNYNKYPLSGFSLDEARKYFGDVNCKVTTIDEIYKITKKPGMLSAIKRLLSTGQIAEDSIEELPDKLPSIFEIEWNQVDQTNSHEVMLLALLAYDKKVNSIESVSKTIGLDAAIATAIMTKFSFIKIEGDNKLVSYVSEPFKKFAAARLKNYKQEITNAIIKDLLKNPHSNDSLNLLPTFLSETGNYNELLSYMTPDYFSEMVKCCQSLSPIIKTAEIGVNAANALKNNSELFRFGLQKSIISQLDGAAIWRSEIEANMSLGDYSSAFALAQSTPTKEDRLHSLALIAKSKREQGFNEDQEIGDIICQLFKEIDFSTLGKRGYEIAEDLIVAYPDIAIELAEKVSSTSDDKTPLDIALTKMSMAALGAGENEANAPNFDAIASRIKNKNIKDFLTATAYVFGNYTVSKLLDEVGRLGSKSDVLILLRQWLKANRKSVDAHLVIEYALNLTIRTSEYSPNATDFKDIAAPLPFLKDSEVAKSLLAKFDSQKGLVERLGPTEDFVRFEISLASTAFCLGLINARDRFVEIYYYISGIDDLVIRGGCYAYMLAMVSKTDKYKLLEEVDKLHSVLKEEIEKDINSLLYGTAHQYDALKRIIYFIAKFDSEWAVKVVESLNTSDERDKGYSEIVRSAVTWATARVDIDFVLKMIACVVDDGVRDETSMRVFDFVENSYGNHPEIFGCFSQLCAHLTSVCDLEARCRSICICLNIIVGQENLIHEKENLLKQLELSWNSISVEWIKIDTGYKIVKHMAKASIDTAIKYMKYVNEVKKDLFIESDTIAINYVSCVLLAMRAFSGLIPKGIYGDEDLQCIYSLISEINSTGERARLLSVLAMYFFKNKKHDVGEKIVLEKIRPLFETIKDKTYCNQLVVSMSPALFHANETIAKSLIAEMPQDYQDDAYYNICKYYLTKVYYVDPCDDYDGFVYKNVNYIDMLLICNALCNIKRDCYIYFVTDDITNTIKKRKDDFTRQQKEEIARKLLEIVDTKLPNANYIKHEGYKIVSKACIGKIISSPTNWDELISQSALIPNMADKALVLAIVFTCLPQKIRDKNLSIVEDVKSAIKSIPSIYDQVYRYESVANIFKEIDKGLCVQCLRIAMDVTSKSSDPEMVSKQKRIVDLAARIDSSLAASFTKIYDDDPARFKNSRELKDYLKILEIKKDIVSEQLNSESFTHDNIGKLPLASWKALGSLNSGMIDPLKIDQVRELVRISSSLSMDKAYPIICLALQNLAINYSKTDQATTILRPTFESIVLACKLSQRMANRSCEIHGNAYKSAEKTTKSSLYIASGQRSKAIDFLQKWLEENMADYLKICDPYFGLSDMEIIRMARGVNSNVHIYVVTSKEHQDKQIGACDLSEAYSSYWKYNISELLPPETEVIVAGLSGTGKLPIHDRWILTKSAGLRIGTSINSIGKNRDSEISVLSIEEACEREAQVDAYIRREKKEHGTGKIKYVTFTL